MRMNHLALVMPVDLAAGDSNALREMLWGKAVELLQPQLGKRYSRFEPAATAWGQSIKRPYGIVLGKNDPVLFLYCYASAKAQQEAVINLHMKGVLDGADPISRNETAGVVLYSLHVNGEDAASAHMLWHLSMIGGELLPDAGLYFLEKQEAFASAENDQRVLSQMNRYALCVVNLVAPEGGVRGA